MDSFLSEHVRLLYSDKEINEDYFLCFDHLLFDWVNVEKSLGCADHVHLSYEERYKAAEHALWGIIYSGGKLLLLTSPTEYKCLLSKSNWYCSYDVERIYDKFIHNPKDSNILLEATLILTALLDRSLGNVVLLKEKEVPFLMRDLLLTQALEDILGNCPAIYLGSSYRREDSSPGNSQEAILLPDSRAMGQYLKNTIMKLYRIDCVYCLDRRVHRLPIMTFTLVFFMQLLMGNVKGLNLRNIAWHGFFAKNELNTYLTATLFLLIPSIANILQSKGYILAEIPRRQPVNASTIRTQSEMFNAYNLELEQYSNTLKELINNFPHISKCQQDFWFYAFHLYCSGCYGETVVIILPLMEHMLRSIYCESNHCLPKKMMAETSEFYITLDVMLEKNYGSCANNFINIMGEKIIQMLLDLFSYQSGPRLRDRVSHFEIQVSELPKEVSRFTITLCLYIIHRQMQQTITRREEMIQIDRLTVALLKYEPLFHPTSLWKKQIICVLNKINEWSGLPKPPEFKNCSLWKNKNFEEVESLLQTIMKKKHFSVDELLQELIEVIKVLNFPSIFRPPKEIEIVYMFSRVNHIIEEIDNNITTNLTLRYNLWNSRQMRSRQRENYGRMLEYIYILQVYLACILHLQVRVVGEFLEINEEQLIFFIKYFKLYLKYVENVFSLSQKDKNRWEEIKNLTSKYCNIYVEMAKSENKC